MLQTINNWILKIETAGAILAAGVAAAIIILQVIFRYFFRAPFDWPEELAVFLLMWITFIGASILLKRNEHIRVSLVLDRFPPVARAVVSLFMDILVMTALAVMIYHGMLLILIHNVSRTVALHIPRGYFFLPLVISSISMVLFLMQNIWNKIGSLKNRERTPLIHKSN